MIYRFMTYLFCLYISLAVPYAYAIDPITGAWTANAAAAAAFGGSTAVGGGGAAIQGAISAAVGAGATAVGAAAAAAVIAGTGVAAFCAASYLYGNNSCGANSPIAGGLQAASISVDPKGDLVFNPRAYFSVPGTTLRFNGATAACQAAVTIANNANAPKFHSLRYAAIYYGGSGAIGGADCHTTFTDPTLAQNQSTDRVGRWVNYVTITTPQKVNPEQVADAVAANPRARAAAAAALGKPTLAQAEAAAAAAATAAAPTRTAEADCAAKGMKHGTFNGTVFCVGVGAGTDGTGAEAGEAGSAEGAGAGTSTGEGAGTGTGAAIFETVDAAVAEPLSAPPPPQAASDVHSNVETTCTVTVREKSVISVSSISGRIGCVSGSSLSACQMP